MYFLIGGHHTNNGVFLTKYEPESDQTSVSNYPFTGHAGNRIMCYLTSWDNVR